MSRFRPYLPIFSLIAVMLHAVGILPLSWIILPVLAIFVKLMIDRLIAEQRVLAAGNGSVVR